VINMNKEDFERMEKEELELAEQRAVARKEGSLDAEMLSGEH